MSVNGMTFLLWTQTRINVTCLCTSVFTEEDCTSISQYQLNSCNLIITEITITPAIVLDKLIYIVEHAFRESASEFKRSLIHGRKPP